MKSANSIALFFSLLVIVFTFVSVAAVQAAPAFAPEPQVSAPVPTLDDLFATLKNLGGFALLVTALVNAGKLFGFVSDGNAPIASLILNGFGLLGLVVLQVSGGIALVPALDQNAGALATALNAVLALIFQIYISRKGHEAALAGMPVVGHSFSGRQAGQGGTLIELSQSIEE